MGEQTKGQASGQPPVGTRYGLGPAFRVTKGDKITIELSPDARKVLNDLLDETDDGPANLFRKALALYKAAHDAHREGKSVGVASSPDALETEFVGF